MDFNALNVLLKKEVDKKEFLRYVGLLLLALTGIAGIGRTITNLTNKKIEKGFGSGKYG